MPTRRKKPVAELRTVNLFTGKTALEEAEHILAEDLASEAAGRSHEPRDLVKEAEDCAVRWLGMDAFTTGDDVKVAVHPAGHAVLVLVTASKVTASKTGPSGTTTLKLSAKQWQKLGAIVRAEGRRHEQTEDP